MESNSISRKGDEEAARWFSRLRAPGCPPATQREFHAWLESDPAHAAAYERAMISAQRVSAAINEDAELNAMLQEAMADRSEATPRRTLLPRWWTLPIGAAAAAVLCLMVADQSWRDPAPAATQVWSNGSDARREVTLEDGSQLLLDVGSSVEVEMQPDSRRLRLLAGRAFFKVAHDKSRPFTVDARDTRTTALGTQFEVDVRGDGTRVTLAEGSVAVDARDGTAEWSLRLAPGQQLVSRHRRAPELRRVDLAQAVGWSTGQLHFQNTALADVVSEWNRYSRVRVTLGDLRLAETRIVGTFAAGGSSSEFITALAAVLPIRALDVGPEEILLVRDY